MRAIVLLAALVAAGCATPAADEPDRPVLPASETGLPEGCDATRAAGGFVPCLHKTGFGGSESNLGVCPKSGVIVASPAVRINYGAGIVVSRDAGATWELAAPFVGDRSLHMFTMDPYMYVDPATCRVFLEDLVTPNCGLVSWSDDEGKSWSHSVDGCTQFDHDNIFAGKPVSSATLGYPSVVYRCGINLVALADASTASTCQKSLDGGRAWVPTIGLAYEPRPMEKGANGVHGACDGAVGHGMVDAKGRVYLPKGWCGQPWLAYSDDEGFTWTRVQIATNGMPRSDSGAIEHEAGVGVDAAGIVYYGWLGEDRLPYYAFSTDDAKSWSAPVPIAPPALKEAALPALDVSPEGAVAFSYYGSYNSKGAPFPKAPDCEADLAGCLTYEMVPVDDLEWHAFVTVVRDAASPRPDVASATLNDLSDPMMKGRCGPLRCQTALDFHEVRFAPDGSAWAVFIDGCDPQCGAALGAMVVGRLAPVDGGRS